MRIPNGEFLFFRLSCKEDHCLTYKVSLLQEFRRQHIDRAPGKIDGFGAGIVPNKMHWNQLSSLL